MDKRAIFFLIILTMLLSLTIVLADQACIIPVGNGDYVCELASAYDGSDFPSYCTGQLGTLGQSSDTRCVLKCCCEGNSPLVDEPVSQTYCQSLDNFRYVPPSGSVDPNQDCTVACGSSGGGTTATYTVSGFVYDDGNNAAALQAAKIEYPLGSVIVTSFTDTTGKYNITNVPEGLRTFKASKIGCGQDQETEEITKDESLDFHLNCVVGNCTINPVNDTAAVAVKGEAKATITWTPSDCADAIGYEITRCANDGQGKCVGTPLTIGFVPPVNAGTFTDVAVPTADVQGAEAGFCYHVNAIKQDGTNISQAVEGAAHCIPPMNKRCTENAPTGSRCYNNDLELKPYGPNGQITPFTGAASCDENNQAEADSNKICGAGEYCYYALPPHSDPTCGSAEQCERCNGLFGWFVDTAARVIPGMTTSCEQLAGCILDNREYAANTFASCEGITSCYDYRSKEACIGSGAGTDQCGVSDDGCVWTMAPGMEELGRGVCRPHNFNEGEAQCESCESIFGFCNKTLCEETLGAGEHCYYNEIVSYGQQGEIEGCVSKEAMACRYYDTKTDCVGSGPNRPQVDVTYNPPEPSLDGERVSGTNNISEAGDDYFGFHRCAWIVDDDATSGKGGYCVKDANGRLGMRRGLVEPFMDDCLESESPPNNLQKCFTDNTAPETTLPFANNEYIDANRLRQSTPVVYDKEEGYLDASQYTRFCLAPSGGAPCYPDTQLNLLLPNETGVASYALYYYSFDAAGNLEPVRSITLNLDRDSGAYLEGASLVS